MRYKNQEVYSSGSSQRVRKLIVAALTDFTLASCCVGYRYTCYQDRVIHMKISHWRRADNFSSGLKTLDPQPCHLGWTRRAGETEKTHMFHFHSSSTVIAEKKNKVQTTAFVQGSASTSDMLHPIYILLIFKSNRCFSWPTFHRCLRCLCLYFTLLSSFHHVSSYCCVLACSYGSCTDD
jgi:hypothetical protein